MYNLIVFILMCAGITKILTEGSIFDKIRPDKQFFRCSLCMGFWVGCIIFLVNVLNGYYLFPNLLLGTLGSGPIGSISSYIICRVVDDDGIKITIQ